jgi:hypothetical protein
MEKVNNLYFSVYSNQIPLCSVVSSHGRNLIFLSMGMEGIGSWINGELERAL